MSTSSTTRVAAAYVASKNALEELENNFVPFISDPLRGDIDGVVDAVLDSFRSSVRKRFANAVFLLKPLEYSGEQIRHYGWSKDTKRGLEGASISGEIKFPKTVTLNLSGSLDVQKIWEAALQAGVSSYTKGIDYKKIERSTQVLKGIVEQEALDSLRFHLLPAQTAERLEDVMFSERWIDDDSTTSYTNYNGEEEEVAEGVSVTHVFTYDALSRDVVVSKKGPNVLIVTMVVVADVRLLKSEPQW